MESSSSPESMATNCTLAIKELVRGREFAAKLQNLLANSSVVDNGCISSEDLVSEILNSFSTTILVLNSIEDEEVSQISRKKFYGVVKSEDSDQNSKSTPVVKNKRGCYKRRKASESFSRVSSTLIDDGRAWRKYGQKMILKTKYPRNYFRCTHKIDQGCQATKQVQRISEEPVMYRTIYSGRHTCNTNFMKAPQILFDSSPMESSAAILSFGANLSSQYHPFFSQEEDVAIPCDMINEHNQSEYVTTGFESSTLGSDQLDTATTCYSFDMDELVGFDDVLHQLEFLN